MSHAHLSDKLCGSLLHRTVYRSDVYGECRDIDDREAVGDVAWRKRKITEENKNEEDL